MQTRRMLLPGRTSHGVACIAAVVAAAVSLLLVVPQGLSNPLPLLSAMVLMLVILRFSVRAVGTFRCEVVVDPVGVLVRNRYRTFRLSWPEIERITALGEVEKDVVTIVTKDGREIPVTAASPARRMSADSRKAVGAYQRGLRNRLADARRAQATNAETTNPIRRDTEDEARST